MTCRKYVNVVNSWVEAVLNYAPEVVLVGRTGGLRCQTNLFITAIFTLASPHETNVSGYENCKKR